MCVQTAKPYVEPPNDVDIKMAIRKYKSKKAAVHDQIPAEMIKEGAKEPMNVIYELISIIWEEDIILHEWKYGIIYPIRKKGTILIITEQAHGYVQHITFRQISYI
jgi:hypothetical protein